MQVSGHHVDFTPMLGYRISVELTTWKEGVHWIHHSEAETYKSEYYEDSGIPVSFLLEYESLQDWSSEIPTDIKSAVLEFEKQFIKHAFSALSFASRSKAAAQMLLSSPILMWMILQHSIQNKLSPEAAMELFLWKRIKILNLYDLPESKAVLRFLYKYKPKDFELSEFNTIKRFVDLFDMSVISRIQNIRYALIRWLIQEPNWIHAGFVKTLDETCSIQTLKVYVQDTFRMGRQLQNPQTQQNLLNCQTFEQVIQMHDRLIERINEVSFQGFENVVYPTPSLEATDSIIPILNHKDLMLEGREMKHCISSYHNRVFDGEYYVFKILKPQRATIGLHNRKGKVVVDQIRLKCNKMPSEETKEKVFWWLQNALSLSKNPL